MVRVGRRRTKHVNWPVGWQRTAGRFYFRPTNKTDREIVQRITGGALCLPLGDTMNDAHLAFARLIVAARKKAESAQPGTVAELCKRARDEYLPTIRSAETREWRERHIDALDREFGARRFALTVHDAAKDPQVLRSFDVQRYLDKQHERPVAGNREMQTWRQVFRWAKVRWGILDYNPVEGVITHPEQPRDVLPAEQAMEAVYAQAAPWLQVMIDLARYYGRRRGEILGLTVSSVRDDGLYFVRGKAKGGRKAREIVIVWDDRLRALIAKAMEWRKAHERARVSSMALMLNEDGRQVTVTGFNSAWRRARERAELDPAMRFNFHDQRAARATSLPPSMATEVLAHDDAATTRRVYRRGPLVVDLKGAS